MYNTDLLVTIKSQAVMLNLPVLAGADPVGNCEGSFSPSGN